MRTLLLALVLALGFGGNLAAQNVNRATRLAIVQDGEYFVWGIVNTSQSRSATFRVQIFQCAGACSSVLDSGVLTLGPDSATSYYYGVSSGQAKTLYGLATTSADSPIVLSPTIGISCPSVPCAIGREIQPGDLVVVPFLAP